MGHQKLSTSHTKNHAPEFLILSALKLPSWELTVFIDMNIYIQKAGGRNFKVLLKEVYPITWDSYHIFTKCWTRNWTWCCCLWSWHALDIPELYSRFIIFQFKQIMNLAVCVCNFSIFAIFSHFRENIHFMKIAVNPNYPNPL